MPLTPTPGTDAANAGMPLVPGTALASDLDEYINQTRDIIAQRTAAVTPVEKGGTGATTAANARTSLGITAANTKSGETLGSTVQADLDFLSSSKASNAALAATNNTVASKASQVDLNFVQAGNMTTDVYNRSITGSRRALWVQDNGQIGYAGSTERHKKFIHEFDITDEQIAMLTVVSYQWRAAVAQDDRREVGLIAERLVDAGLGWAVFFDADGTTPEGINYDMIGVALLPAVQRLLVRVAALEARE